MVNCDIAYEMSQFTQIFLKQIFRYLGNSYYIVIENKISDD